jgi:hypothetical protein
MNIFKRKKPLMPEPKFENNWMQDMYEQNVKDGIKALQAGRTVNIMDDGRGYELALGIKRGFILEYQKQLAEKIEIKNEGAITIKFKTT